MGGALNLRLEGHSVTMQVVQNFIDHIAVKSKALAHLINFVVMNASPLICHSSFLCSLCFIMFPFLIPV